MLNSLKKLFKNNTKLIKIADSIYSDKKIYCFAELYEKLGLDKYIEQMKKSNEFDKYHDWISKQNINYVCDLNKIISQGKISEILSGKVSDRRAIIEEAAGVLKYKKHKEETLRKIADKAFRLFTSIGENRLSLVDVRKTLLEEYDFEINFFD